MEMYFILPLLKSKFMNHKHFLFALLAFVFLTSCGDKDWSEVAGPRAIEKELTHGQSAIFTFETYQGWGCNDNPIPDFGDKAAVKCQNVFIYFHLIWTNNTSKAIYVKLPDIYTDIPEGGPFPEKFRNYLGIHNYKGEYQYSLLDANYVIDLWNLLEPGYCIPAHSTCKMNISPGHFPNFPEPWPWAPGTYQVKMKYDFPVTIYDKDYAVVENEHGEQEFEQGAVVEEETTISVDYDMTLVCLE